MKIAHLPSSYHPDALGGTENYVSSLVQALNLLGHENRVLVHATSKGQQPDPVELVRLPVLPNVTRRMLYANCRGDNPPGFQEFIRDWKPDLVHFHAFTLGAGLDHVRVLNEQAIPYIVTYHTPAQSCPRGTLMLNGDSPCDGKLIASRCARCVLNAKGIPRIPAFVGSISWLPHTIPDGPWVSYVALPSLLETSRQSRLQYFLGASKVVACAPFCKHVLVANGVPGEKVQVLRQALPGRSRSREIQLAHDSRQLKIGYFGRVTPVKGVDLAVSAMERLTQDGLNVDFQVVGPILDEERSWASTLFRRRFTRYLGTLTGVSLQAWLRQLDLVVIPSRWLETGPLTLLEAWDQGTAVIGTRAGGIEDFMVNAGHSQCLFDIENPIDLADKIKWFSQLSQPLPQVMVPGLEELSLAYDAIYRECSAMVPNTELSFHV